jgi:hypothetical protein
MTAQVTTQVDSKSDHATLDKALPRIRDFFVHAVGQKYPQKVYPGIMHLLIFWGVLIQVVGTIINILNMLYSSPG